MTQINPTRCAVGDLTIWRITILGNLKHSNFIIIFLLRYIPRIQTTKEKKNKFKLVSGTIIDDSISVIA